MSLGLYLKHSVFFENQCHLLDVKIAQTSKTENINGFVDTVKAFNKARQLDEEEADSLGDGANILIEHLASVQDETEAAVYRHTVKQH